MQAHLFLGGHGAGGDPHGVDAPRRVLVDLDVGLLLGVPDRVNQVQDVLVVELG